MTRRTDSVLSRWVSRLAAIAVLGLLFVMIVLPLHQEDVFLSQDTVSATEGALIVALGVVLVFDILSFVWLTSSPKEPDGFRVSHPGTLALGALALVLLMGDKALLDEIARETRLGLEARGEWMVLYGSFLVQLAYGLLILHWWREGQAPGPPAGADR